MIDNLIVSAYLIIVLGLGIYNRSRATTLNDYIKIGKSLENNKLILTATIFATAVGGGTTFGVIEKSFNSNMAFTYGLILTIPIDIAIAIYIVPRINQYSGVTSIGEIIELHYGKSGRILTGIAATFISVGYLAAQIIVSGRIFQFLTGSTYIQGIIISYMVVIIYTTVGGLKSIVINNLLQFLAMLAAIPTITIIGISYIGLDLFFQNIPLVKYDVTNISNISDTFYAILSFSVMGFYPSFIQRTLINKNSDIIKRAIFYKSIIYFIFLICLTANGLIAAQLMPAAPTNSVVLTMIDILASSGLKGLIIVGLLGAVMSTADSDLNIASISLVNDIIKPITKTQNQQILVIITQIFTVIIGGIVIFVAMKFQSVVDLVIFAAGFWAPMIAVPLIGILFNRIISLERFIASALSGACAFLLWEIYGKAMYNLSGVFVGTIVCLIIFLTSPTVKSSTNFKVEVS